MLTEKNVSRSQIYPIICGLTKNTVKTTDDESQLVKKVKETIASELTRRYQATSTDIFSTTAGFVTILDPRYKRLPFFTTEQRKKAKESLDSRLDDVPLKLP